MFPTNETNNSFFGFGLPVSFPKLMAGLFYFQTVCLFQCLIKLKQVYFPIDYQVCFLEYLIKQAFIKKEKFQNKLNRN